MDKMIIKSTFTTKIISKLITRYLRKHFKIDIHIGLNQADVNVGDEYITMHLDGDVVLNKDSLTKLIRMYEIEVGEI